MYGPEAGKEIMPGVRQVIISEYPATFGGYAKVVVSDYVYAPGMVEPSSPMPNDMICQMIEGELLTKLRDEEPSISKLGRVWTCAKEALEQEHEPERRRRGNADLRSAARLIVAVPGTASL